MIKGSKDGKMPFVIEVMSGVSQFVLLTYKRKRIRSKMFEIKNSSAKL